MSVILDGVPINFQCYLLDITHPKGSALRNTNKWTLETLQRPNLNEKDCTLKDTRRN